MACKYTYKGITYNSKEEFINQIINPQILGKPDVILPIGTSGSGKSTFIKSLPQENLVVIEPDTMRVEFTGDMNDKSKDKEIYIEAANRAVQAIKKGKQVVFDTTNLTKDKRLPFIEAIKKVLPNANIQYKLMELNPELAKQRIKADIAAGKNRANVPDATIDRHAESYKQMLEDIKSEPITPFVNRADTKTRRILEVQSDLFQKGREQKDLIGKEYHITKSNDQFHIQDSTGDYEESFDTLEDAQKGLIKYNGKETTNKNNFLQLLNKDNNWVTFFIKSIIQDTVKQTITEVQESDVEAKVRELEKEGLLEIDCKGKLKAEKGLKTNFTKGGKWKLIKDLKGYPTHKEGGVDLTIGKNGVSIKNGNTEFTAKHGLVIPKN